MNVCVVLSALGPKACRPISSYPKGIASTAVVQKEVVLSACTRRILQNTTPWTELVSYLVF